MPAAALDLTSDEEDASDTDAPARVVWTPDRTFIGALLWSPVDRATQVLAEVAERDLTDPAARLVLDLARELVDSGRAPDPQAVLSRGVESGRAASEHGTRRLGLYLMETYNDVPDRAGLRDYAADVLAARYRASFAELADRLHELSATGSTEELEHSLGDHLETMRDYRRRLSNLRAAPRTTT